MTWRTLLSQTQIQEYYATHRLVIPKCWKVSRKHFRIQLADERFVKLNRFENRLTADDLRFWCWRLKPRHVYFSVLNWLLPEYVGKKYKGRYCVPLAGEYVIDIDSYLMIFKHKHKVDDHWYVCEECLEMSRRLTLQLCEIVHKYYSKIAVVFSGCAGFHVHVFDFTYHDWVPCVWNNPLWAHSAARFKFTKLLQKQTHVFDRAHFVVSCDPMRVVTVPNTINGKTGLVCRFIGTPKDLELLTISELLEMSKAFPQGYPEPLESSLWEEDGNGAVKSCAKNTAEAT